MTTDKITTVEMLKEYLYLAIQLEHATIPPYLTALYSIKPGTNFDAVQVLRVVAVEEMLHMTIAANLINAIGGQPDLTRPGFVPAYPAYLPDGENDFQLCLQAFSEAAIDNFKAVERPRKTPEAQSKLVNRTSPARASMLAAPPGTVDIHFYSIGDFYAAIDEGFHRLETEAQAAGGTIFVKDTKRQITSEYYYSGGGRLAPVCDLKSAREGIRLIMEQGEGVTRGVYDHDKELAHYYRFDQLTHGRYYEVGNEPGCPTGPTFTVDWDQAYPIKTDIKLADMPAGSELHDAAVAFNNLYARFLKVLTRAFNGEPELLLTAVPKMFDFRNRVTELIRNPLPGTAFNAAPTFEVNPPPPTLVSTATATATPATATAT